MGRKKIVDVGWSVIGADMDRVEGALRRKEEERRIREAIVVRRVEKAHKARLRIIDAIKYVRESGVFYRKLKDFGQEKINLSEMMPNEQRFIAIGMDRYKAEDVAWLYCHKFWPERELIHRDGDKGNNRLNNLMEMEQQ